jgi:hypothetical protein
MELCSITIGNCHFSQYFTCLCLYFSIFWSEANDELAKVEVQLSVRREKNRWIRQHLDISLAG